MRLALLIKEFIYCYMDIVSHKKAAKGYIGNFGNKYFLSVTVP